MRVEPFTAAEACELRAVIAGHPSADGLPPGALPITRGTLSTRSILGLRPVARVSVDADQLGFHTAIYRPQTLNADGSRPRTTRTDFLTVGGEDDGRVLLRFPDDGPQYTRLLDLLVLAIADQLGGVLWLDLVPDPHDPAGWQIIAANYDDSEGVRA